MVVCGSTTCVHAQQVPHCYWINHEADSITCPHHVRACIVYELYKQVSQGRASRLPAAQARRKPDPKGKPRETNLVTIRINTCRCVRHCEMSHVLVFLDHGTTLDHLVNTWKHTSQHVLASVDEHTYKQFSVCMGLDHLL
jgi:hypothetical protein